jgi:CMP-N,N'-diacetyllegionaminic acid synthase
LRPPLNSVLGVIPARGGSKRIPKKNIKLFAGQPLIAHSIVTAIDSECFSRIIVSTEDPEIAAICETIAPNLSLARPTNLALDDTPTLPVIQHAVRILGKAENYYPDVVVVLQPTSPFRTTSDIKAVVRLIQSKGADSVVSVVEIPHQFNEFSAMKIVEGQLHACHEHSELENISQKKPSLFARNGCFNSVCTYECLMKKNSLYGKNCIPYIMAPDDSIDLDTELDWKFAEHLFQQRVLKAKQC